MDMVLSDGFKFGNAARFALRQSMYSVESACAQNSRSASSAWNSGSGLSFLGCCIFFPSFFIIPVCLRFPLVHIARRNDTNRRPTYRECREKQSPAARLPQDVIPLLATRVANVAMRDDRHFEEDLLRLPRRNLVTIPNLPFVRLIPVEAIALLPRRLHNSSICLPYTARAYSPCSCNPAVSNLACTGQRPRYVPPASITNKHDACKRSRCSAGGLAAGAKPRANISFEQC